MRQLRKLCLFFIFPLFWGTGCDQPDASDQVEFSKSNHHSYWLHDLQQSNDTLLKTFLTEAGSIRNKPAKTPQDNLPYELNIASYLKLVVESILEQENSKDGKKTWQATMEYIHYPQDMLDYIKEHSDIPKTSKDRLTELFVNRLDQANKKNFNRQQICIDLLLLQYALLTEFEVNHKND